jgi:hypothetical protein
LDKPRLRYYDTPDVIFIPLHTPPEEKEFSELKKKNGDGKKHPLPVAVPKVPEIALKNPPKPKIAPTAQIEKMQSTDEIELQDMLPQREIPKPPPPPPPRSTHDEVAGGSSLWSVEVQRHSSQESQETVISSQPKADKASKNGMPEKPAIPTFIDTINENPPLIQNQEMSAKGRHKKHILFSTKIGSGSEEQMFSTQLSLSKTESQSSQLSEQTSVFESPKNEIHGTKMQEVTEIKLKHQTSSEVEKVTATSARSRRSDQSDSAESRPQSVTRKQQRDSGEFSQTKRDSSDDATSHKKRSSGEPKLESQSSHSHHSLASPVMPPSRDSQNSLKQQQQQQQHVDVHLQHQSSGSRMEISSESDRESDMEACIHKSVSRVMEDHESAGLVLQESFDDELPYVPTTLPEERCTGTRIIPTKERTHNELITIPVDRPRSTTPINPASLDNYCERKQSNASDVSLVRGEKLRISLPKQKAEQNKEKVQQKCITRRISNLSNKSWTEFAEQNLHQSSTASTSIKTKTESETEKARNQSNSSQDDEPPLPPPPPPPSAPAFKSSSHSKKSLTSKWIDFENIPEKRQPPKKITTIPIGKEAPHEKNNIKHSHSHHQRHHYVSPEECQCECHEHEHQNEPESNKQSPADVSSGITPSSDDSQPLLDDHAERPCSVIR